MDKSTTYIGLDVHKDTIAVALAEAGVRSDVREYGKIANTPAAAQALAMKLSRVGNVLGSPMRPDLAAMGFNASSPWPGTIALSLLRR